MFFCAMHKRPTLPETCGFLLSQFDNRSATHIFPPINPYISLSFKTEKVYKNLEVGTFSKRKVFRTQSTQIILKERKTNIATVMLYCSYNNCNVLSSEGLFLHLPNLHIVVVTAASDIIEETVSERIASMINNVSILSRDRDALYYKELLLSNFYRSNVFSRVCLSLCS